MSASFGKIALVGIGLIGSSLAHVIRRKGLADEIAVSTRSAKTLERARQLGLGHRYFEDEAEAVAGAALVLYLCRSALPARWRSRSAGR
jgi:cyclohexadieny/prephenate dehydrogenase